MSRSLKVCFSLFYYNLKGKDHNRRKTSTKKNINMWNQYYYHYLMCQELGSVGPTQQKIKFSLPNIKNDKFW